MQATDVDAAVAEAEVCGGVREPLPVAVPGGGGAPERVVLHSQDGEVVERASGVGGGVVEQSAQPFAGPVVGAAVRLAVVGERFCGRSVARGPAIAV